MKSTSVKTNAPAPAVQGAKQMTASLQSGKIRYLGIHGARGTGKTCFLACLYGNRATEQAAVTFSNDSSIDHLQSAWKVLQHGEVPDATALAHPTELHMGLNSDGLGWNVTTKDYAGALVQRSETGVPKLKEEVKQWLRSCHAILLFVNIDSRNDAHDSDLKKRHDELDLLLTELKNLSHDGNTVGRPLALLLTKWDIQGQPCDDPVRERKRALEYLQSRPALKQIADALRNCGDRVEIFPVSAFGSHRDGNRPPADGPRSVGLHRPLVWAAQKADEMLLERARREADNAAGPHLRWWQRRYAPAVASYQRLIAEHGVNKGPTYGEARKELNRWRTRLYGRRAWQGVTGLVLTLALVVAGLMWHDKEGYQGALALLGDASAAPQNVGHACKDYMASRNPLAQWTGHRDVIARQWQAYRQNREEQEYEALEVFREENTDDAAGGRCADKAKDFLQRWPGSPHSATVEGWERIDRDRFEQHQAYLRLESDYNGLLSQLAKLGDNYEKLMAECGGFLQKYPKVQYPKMAHMIEDVQEKRTGFEAARDDRDWAAVVNYNNQNPRNFDEIIRKAVEYANRPGVRKAKEAKDLIARTEVLWDRNEYDKVRDAVSEAKDAAAIEAAEKVARQYVGGVVPLKKREETVKKWLAWFNGFKDERDYNFTIKSLLIPVGSDLDHGGNDTKITVRFGDRMFETGWGFLGNNPQVNKQIGPIRFKWGQPATLEFTVEKYRYPPFSNRKATGKVEDDRFALGRVNGTFTATCAEGKAVEIHLECPAAIPPKMDTYPER